MDGFLQKDPSFPTRAIHQGNEPEQWNSRAAVPPITLSTTFKQDAPGNNRGFEYGRSGNPTRNCTEACLASLEQAKHALLFSSGVAGITTITHLLSAGDHIITMDDMYGGSTIYFREVATRFGIEVDFIDCTDHSNIEKAIRSNTKMVWVESPSNPTLKLVDIQTVANIIHKQKDIIFVVDNTFLSPYFQLPLTMGADIVFNSCTKYLNGHTDVLMGSAATNQDTLTERLRFLQNAIGAVPSPFDCYLLNRSLKTLAVRMEKHSSNSLAIAMFLEGHPCVEKVLHPGLLSHPQHKLAKKQCYGHSGMLSFYIKGNDLSTSRRFFAHLKIVKLAESLGGYETVAKLPSIMPLSSVSHEQRVKLGITDGLVRLSCGLEDAQDLCNDLDLALRAALLTTGLK